MTAILIIVGDRRDSVVDNSKGVGNSDAEVGKTYMVDLVGRYPSYQQVWQVVE